MNTELTKGQKLVGLTFNPSGDDQVTKFKQACANAIDILLEGKGTNHTANSFIDLAVHSLLTGQMFGVKAKTWKE